MTESRFRGCLLGAFVGDALGMPFEGWPPERIAGVQDQLKGFHAANPLLRGYAAIEGVIHGTLQGFSRIPLGSGTYTDDTQMTIGVAESLIACRGFDGADMARRFVENFDARRGYGPGAKRALKALRDGMPWDQVGSSLFQGAGSLGNGSAMRVAPVGLLYNRDPVKLREVAEASASITHTHPVGKEGAALQAYAVSVALTCDPEQSADVQGFMDCLRQFARTDRDEFPTKLAAMLELLSRTPSVQEVVDALGNDVMIHASVPAAIYSFLSHPGSFSECVIYAVTLGGDTDTIASMAGAIAGAFHGVEAIPAEWQEGLENDGKGRDYVLGLASDLWCLAGEIG